jgi:DNA-binding FadR family transcriptional regulator
MFRPIRGGNAFEETIERLFQIIKLGVVKPGEKLPPERELAAVFRISRETLRDAMQSMQREGYIEARLGRGGGQFVLQVPSARVVESGRPLESRAAELNDVLGLRFVLERGAAELAARRTLTYDDESYLRDACNACTDPMQEFRPADSRLHIAIAELSGSASLAIHVAEMRARLNDLLDLIPLLPPNIEHSHRQHVRIVNAVIRGDSAAAVLAVERHLAASASLLRAFLD